MKAGLAFIAVILAWIYFSGAADVPLSQVGLNHSACAERLIGGRLCGDELKRFCREHYDSDINADTCDDVLRDAGLNPREIASRIASDQRAEERARQRQEDAAVEQRRRRAAIPARLGEQHSVSKIAFRITDVAEQTTIGPSYDRASAGANHYFVVVRFDYRNLGRKSRDVLCAFDSAALVDRSDRAYSPDSDVSLTLPRNDEACSGGVQPGDEDTGEVAFRVRSNVRPVGVLLWDPSTAGPEDASPFLAVKIPRSAVRR